MDAGRYQIDVAVQVGHLKDVDDIVGHDLSNISDFYRKGREIFNMGLLTLAPESCCHA